MLSKTKTKFQYFKMKTQKIQLKDNIELLNSIEKDFLNNRENQVVNIAKRLNLKESQVNNALIIIFKNKKND